MEKTDEYLEPRKYYDHYLKQAHLENTAAYFEELTKKSGVDVEANHITMDKYRKESEVLNALNKKLGHARGLIGLMIFLMIAGFLAGIILIVVGCLAKPINGLFIGIGGGSLAIGIFALIFWLAYLRKRKNAIQAKVNAQQKVVDALEAEARAQMAPLNNLFNANMSTEICNKTAPLIHFDETLTDLTEERIIKQFNTDLDYSEDHSTLVVQSGDINTNPFILRQYLEMKMVPHIYTGTLIITYTRRVSDGNGGTKTVTVTQTLVAHVTRPEPQYSVNTQLEYYSDAAPNLSFTREPSGMSGLSEKEINKIADKRDKEETKKAEKALKQGKTYTKFANSKFEAYFNASNRDNELEYRMLFTPLAQTNYIYNNAQTKPFSDDIYFMKNKMQNVIVSSHDVNRDYSGGENNYYHFDYEQIKKNFINYNTNFFEGIYFDMIPLLSIPLYHQHQSAQYITERNRKEQVSFYEAEVIANKFEPKLFKPADCDTEVILKVNRSDNSLLVKSYGYHADPRVEFVPTLGGDGLMHPVPVHYFEYLPVVGNNVISLNANNLDKKDKSVINYRMYKATFAK